MQIETVVRGVVIAVVLGGLGLAGYLWLGARPGAVTSMVLPTPDPFSASETARREAASAKALEEHRQKSEASRRAAADVLKQATTPPVAAPSSGELEQRARAERDAACRSGLAAIENRYYKDRPDRAELMAAASVACPQASAKCQAKAAKLRDELAKTNFGPKFAATSYDQQLNSCVEYELSQATTTRQIELDARREERPDGDWVRMTVSKQSEVEACMARAFGGISPIPASGGEIMRKADPKWLRFQQARLIGEELLAGVRAFSHSGSHYVVTQRADSVITFKNSQGMSDNRPAGSVFILDRAGERRFVIRLPSSPNFPFSSFGVVMRTSAGTRIERLEPVAGHSGIWSTKDPGLFVDLVVFGGDRPSPETGLYRVASSPELEQRAGFFDCVSRGLKR